MNRRLVYFLAASAVVAGLLAGIAILTAERDIILFEGVNGPRDRSVVQARQPTSWTKYEGGGGSRLSVLLTDENSAWLGLVHGLKSAGISFSVTTDYPQTLITEVLHVTLQRFSFCYINCTWLLIRAMSVSETEARRRPLARSLNRLKAD